MANIPVPKEFKYYKVLRLRGDILCGGYSTFDYTPYLPKGKKPGKWLPRRDKLEMCHRGWHVTRRPRRWYASGRCIFLVEIQGNVIADRQWVYARGRGSYIGYTNKICCRRIRLVKEITGAMKKRVLMRSYQRITGDC